jgi:hypothetical protein
MCGFPFHLVDNTPTQKMDGFNHYKIIGNWQSQRKRQLQIINWIVEVVEVEKELQPIRATWWHYNVRILCTLIGMT